MGKGDGKASSHITYEDSNEDLIDEVNAFHAKDRQINKNDIRRRKVYTEPVEVLNVEADASDSSDDEDESDFDDDDINDITDNKWGQKRKNFYGTGYVDEDWGGMREEEEENAALEEEDALNRQKALDKSTAAIADLFDDDDDEDEEEEEENVEVATSLEFNSENARIANKKTRKLIEQFSARKQIFDLVIRPLDVVIEKLPKCALRQQIVYITETYAAYLMNVAFYLRLKASQFDKEQLQDPLVDVHPVVEAIAKLSKKISEVEVFVHSNSEKLDELKKLANTRPREVEALVKKIGNVSLSKKQKTIKTTADDLAADDGRASLNYTPMDADEKRKANDAISKNKRLADKKGKKKAKTSKTKNRRKVHAIEKKVKSQIGNVRREMTKYGGETKGIRASTIKSTKLIA